MRKLPRKNGIVLLNCFGWIFLVAVVVLLYQHLTRIEEEVENNKQPRTQSGVEPLSVAMLLPYHLASAILAVKRRKPRYLLYSVVFHATLVVALGHR